MLRRGYGIVTLQVVVSGWLLASAASFTVQVKSPGTGFDPPSIENIALASSFTSIDFDHALRIVVAEGGGLGNDIAQLDFVACSAAPAPVVGDFTCTVKDAADASSQPLTTTCSVTIP